MKFTKFSEGKADWSLILSEIEPEISKLTNTGFEYNGIIFKVKIVSLKRSLGARIAAQRLPSA